MSHRPDPKKNVDEQKEQELETQLSSYEVLRKIHPSALKMEAIRGEIDIHQQLEIIIAQLARKTHQAWSEFPDLLVIYGCELAAQGQALIREGKRLAGVPPMPVQHEPLRKFSSPADWQKSLTEDEAENL